jgi:hypothetical protein
MRASVATAAHTGALFLSPRGLQEAARAARKRRAGALIEGSFLEEEEAGEGEEGGAQREGGEADELAAAERRYAVELAKELKVSWWHKQAPSRLGGMEVERGWRLCCAVLCLGGMC